mmetsp:Transcript_25577/g.31499  ORF Transcript_25577/g.31499 Transcript_25577/m.31499 type:complete len:87 (+) Transcript_25577:54-314(+)
MYQFYFSSLTLLLLLLPEDNGNDNDDNNHFCLRSKYAASHNVAFPAIDPAIPDASNTIKLGTTFLFTSIRPAAYMFTLSPFCCNPT